MTIAHLALLLATAALLLTVKPAELINSGDDTVASGLEGDPDAPNTQYPKFTFTAAELGGERDIRIVVAPDVLFDFQILLQQSAFFCDQAGANATTSGGDDYGLMIGRDEQITRYSTRYCKLYVAHSIIRLSLNSDEMRFLAGGLRAIMAHLNYVLMYVPRASSNNPHTHSDVCSTSSSHCRAPSPVPLADRMVNHVTRCFRDAQMLTSKVEGGVLLMKGYSGTKTRHLYNNLCELVVDPTRKTEYLEVGAYAGSSVVSSLYKNTGTLHGTVIEDWHEFDTPRALFLYNVGHFNVAHAIDVYEEDFFSFDVSRLPQKIDIYLYDGDHEYESHFKAITVIWSALADQAIVIVDDWSAAKVRNGTMDGFAAVNAHIVERFEVKYMEDISIEHTPHLVAGSEFWNGIAVFVIDKTVDHAGSKMSQLP